MPSQQHEYISMLFRTPSVLLVQSIGESPRVVVPSYQEVRTDSADLTDIQPAEYRADLVVTLRAQDGAPVMGVIVEVQLSRDERKPFVWPAYVVNLRARLECPVCLLVVTLDESVARWAAQPVEIGGGNTFAFLVLGPAQIPKVTDWVQACQLPELAVLSAMAHGRSAPTELAVQIGLAARQACSMMDAERATLYSDIIFAALSDEARQEIANMEANVDEPTDDWSQVWFDVGRKKGQAAGRAEGRTEGRSEGRADVIRKLLAARFGAISSEIESRISASSEDELDSMALRILTATTVDQVVVER